MRACDLLEAFTVDGEALRLRDLAARTGMNRSTAFRLLRTLQSRGLIERSRDQEFRSRVGPIKRRRYRIGYAAQSSGFAFARDVTEGILRAAAERNLDLMVLDNRYSSKVAVRNVEVFVREAVELVIEFQTDEHVAPIISSKLHDANIPLIAIEIPHPGGTFFGIDNYRAGVTAGRHLGRWCREHWQGQVDEILLLELAMAGSLPRSRLAGTIAGIVEILPGTESCHPIRLDGNGEFGASLEAVRKHLQRSRGRRILVGTVNDPSALGAVRAFEEAGRAAHVAVIGHGGTIEGRTELRTPGSRLVGSVAYFPERYGDAIMTLAVDILAGKPLPPALFVKHHLLTLENVDHFYPNDSLIGETELDRVLFHPSTR